MLQMSFSYNDKWITTYSFRAMSIHQGRHQYHGVSGKRMTLPSLETLWANIKYNGCLNNGLHISLSSAKILLKRTWCSTVPEMLYVNGLWSRTTFTFTFMFTFYNFQGFFSMRMQLCTTEFIFTHILFQKF